MPSAGSSSEGAVDLAEISGSETYVHVHRERLALVAQIPGVHDLPLNSQCTLYFDPAELYGFDAGGALLFAPENLSMARIELIGVGHAYAASGRSQAADAWALQPMDMTWDDGGAYALLGPSGCGKTTLLNIISGLITPTRGRVLFDGRDVTALAPEAAQHRPGVPVPGGLRHDDRVRQSRVPVAQPALGGRGCRAGASARSPRSSSSAAILRKRALALSADEKQKISLGRGLVRPDVAAVLFDEPLTVIDPQLKWLLRRKLKQIHQQLKLSLIYVTHDQTEALTFADQIVVMTRGDVVQVGTAEALFEAPAHRFVGHFIGSPGHEFPRLRLGGRRCAGRRRSDSHVQGRPAPRADAALAVGIRPEYVEVAAAHRARTAYRRRSWRCRIGACSAMVPHGRRRQQLLGATAKHALAADAGPERTPTCRRSAARCTSTT